MSVIGSGVPRNTLTARLLIWPSLLAAFREHPILGWGLGAATRVNPVKEIERNVGSDPHNDCILFMVEGGAVGLAGLVAFHVAALLLIARRAERLRGTAAHARAAGLWITCVALMVGSLANNLLSFTAFLMLFWGWAACALYGDGREEPAPSDR